MHGCAAEYGKQPVPCKATASDQQPLTIEHLRSCDRCEFELPALCSTTVQPLSCAMGYHSRAAIFLIVFLLCRSPGKRALVPHLNLPTSQQPLLHSPSSSTTSSARHFAAPSLLAAATPLMTSRPPAHAASSSRMAHCSAADAANTNLQQTPAAAAAAAHGGSTLRMRYHTHRRTRAVYVDQELHMLCLELALHLLSSPSGMLDPLQLPQDAAGALQMHTIYIDRLVRCGSSHHLRGYEPPLMNTKST
jgi:hypothetical protein